VRAAIADAADAGAGWLRHPCMSRLTLPEPSVARRDVTLVTWVAGHTDHDLGAIVLPEPVMLWSAAGDELVDAGRHDLATLGALVARAGPIPLALDVWCRSTGVVGAGTWAALDEADLAERTDRLAGSVMGFLRTMAALAARRPDVFGWVAAATSVVRPLVPLADRARSAHSPSVPGLVEADLDRGPVQTIELVVHETAHLHLRAAEAAGDLVEPGHVGTYASPLRPEPRPLAGILLAYHALAYICAALAEAAEAGVVDAERAGQAVADLARRRDEARTVLDEAGRHLTEAGAAFVERTHRVAEHEGADHAV
jgi:HEXXH motif-containing protein